MNSWNGIVRFYSAHKDLICNSRPDEWAIPAYSWDPLVDMTPIEAWLWDDIRGANVVMYPQWPVDGVFLDFANPAALVAIECDGHAFHLDKAKDRDRDLKLEALGWRIYRISGSDCMSQYDEETGELGEARKFIDAICTKPPTTATKASIAEKLARISEELHGAAGDMNAIGWDRHASEIASMSALLSIYVHQQRGKSLLGSDA